MSPKPKAAEEKPVAQTVKLEQRLFERLKVFSAKTRRSHQDILRTALLEYLKHTKKAFGECCRERLCIWRLKISNDLSRLRIEIFPVSRYIAVNSGLWSVHVFMVRVPISNRLPVRAVQIPVIAVHVSDSLPTLAIVITCHLPSQ
jgi:hypothetical protein